MMIDSGESDMWPINAKVHIQSVEAIVRKFLMSYQRDLVGSEAEKRLVEELQKL
jgi:hypothetical protein